MKQKLYTHLILLALLLFFSCQQKQSEISKDFNCEITTFKDLETVADVNEKFSIQLPKYWKTNLYQDNLQSSIFSADTIKQLTETFLLDVTFINRNINFNEDFLLKQEQENLKNNLIKINSKATTLFDKPAYYFIFKGKKREL